MSKGVLITAFDSVTDQGNQLCYRKLAQVSAGLARKHLKLPVAIVTDKPIEGFDEQIIVNRADISTNSRTALINNLHESYNWHNDYRRQLFDLTPWDQTLLIDSDYFIQSDSLRECFETDYPFQLVSSVYDPTGRRSFDKYARMPNRTIPQCWATVMYWNRSAKQHFEYANMIAENYDFYANIFGFSSREYRNDFVFSIVAHMLPTAPIPGKMWMTSSDTHLHEFNPEQRHMRFIFDNKAISIRDMNVHVLNKSILKPDVVNHLKEMVNELCEFQ